MIPEPPKGLMLYILNAGERRVCACERAPVHSCESNYIDGIPCVCNASIYLEPHFAQQMLSTCYLLFACLTERIQSSQGPAYEWSRV